MSGIFVSYRQDDTNFCAQMLREELATAFGDEQVFLDKDSLHAGLWRGQLQQALESSSIVLVLIGSRWLTAVDADGARRLDCADDVHRQEIAFALSQPQVTVVPVLVDGARQPARQQLPAELSSLCDRQWRKLSADRGHSRVDIDLLVADVERALGLRRRASAPAAAGQLMSWVDVAAWVFALTLATLVGLYLSGPPPSADETLLVLLLAAAVVVFGRRMLQSRRKRKPPPP